MKGNKWDLRVSFLVARNFHNLESLALTIEITRKHKSTGGKATHTRLKLQQNHAHT
jgi:hypothetical protein